LRYVRRHDASLEVSSMIQSPVPKLGLSSMLMLTLLGSGCASTQSAEVAKPAATSSKAPAEKAKQPQAPAPEQSAATAVKRGSAPTTSPIFFAYDSAILTDEGRDALDRMATYLKSDDVAAMTIEGHADERGSDAYNLSLGQQRADAIERYLRNKGVSEKRLRSVSYGEHRPAVQGRDEGAWSQNRRGELRVEDHGTSKNAS
jgi:peptidoglycan-associated lipoprotein